MEKTATYTYKHSDIFLRIIHGICKIKLHLGTFHIFPIKYVNGGAVERSNIH